MYILIYIYTHTHTRTHTHTQCASLVAQIVKNPPAMQETQVPSLGQEDPWRREWLPIPIFLSGESHGQRSLVGYSPRGRKESDKTERLTLLLFIYMLLLVLLSRFSRVRPRRRQPTRLPHPWDSPGKNPGVGCQFLLQCMKVKSESEVAQSCLTLSNPMDCSLPGSSVHGIFQARVLEWGAIAFSIYMHTYKINQQNQHKFES